MAAKYGVVLFMGVAHVQHGEPALLEPGRHLPVRITGHQQPHVVVDPERLPALELDRMALAGDQVLQLAFGLLVASPETLVGVQHQQRDHVAVEPSGDVTRVRHQLVVHAEQALHHLAELGLADALLAAQRERGAALERGSLEDIGQPRHHPRIELGVAAADVVAYMRQEFRAVALARFDRETAPQIVEVRLSLYPGKKPMS